MYGVTLIVFSMNMTKPQDDAPQPATDEEARPTTTPPPRTNTASSVVQPGSPLPPSVTQPLRVDTLPKDFEPLPQTQEHYLTPEQAAEAGIEPPTPVLKAQMAEKEKEKSPVEKGKARADTLAPEVERASSPVSPLEQEKEK